MNKFGILALAAWLATSVATAGGATAQPRPGAKAQSPAGPPSSAAPKGAEDALAAKPAPADGPDSAEASAVERKSVTKHAATIRGRRYEYTAVAGTLTLRDDEGRPTGSMFYVAYLLDGPKANRPVTFLWNGGPGSSSMWLHMASFGPKRAELAQFNRPDRTMAPSFVDNDESLLPGSDLVFLDMMNTGYSRPLGDAKPQDFWSADADIGAFTQGIQRFLTLQNRWSSPKFLIGESYGTTRNAGVVNRLQTEGVLVNGIIQIGSILDVGVMLSSTERSYVNRLPTFALAALHHGKVAYAGDPTAYLQEVAAWDEGTYAVALAKGDALPEEERRSVAAQMSKYIGLPTQLILERNLRIDDGLFRSELLRDKGVVIGQLDTRFTAQDPDAAAARPTFDPSYTFIFRPMIESFNTYIREDLGFRTGLTYRRSFESLRFDFNRRNGGGYGRYGADLANAMKTSPNLRVLVLSGLYDDSTPVHGADYDYAHLGLPPSLRAHLKTIYLEAGHMAYADDVSRRRIADDILKFYGETAP